VSTKDDAKQLAMAFKEKGIEIQSALERGLLAASIFVQGDAKKRVPVDTGLLRGSITHRVILKDGVVIGQVGTLTEDGPYVEFGSSRQKAQPFLTPALTENKTTISNIITKELKKEL
jgi:HK97 gp10 family phage protein